uniref:UPF3A regulator of nonsense mediated mRNA decay n=1 Tax=Sus scrofa TaxID=9823 RepID=I3LNG6_PIG
MRSEKEGGEGPRVAVVARGPSGREKALPAEIQICQESLRRELETPLAPSSGSGGNGGKPREEKRTVLSKVVVRRLPPSLTREQLEEQLQPLPAHDYFEFFTADLSLYPHLYSRAYINFRNPDDILLFRDLYTHTFHTFREFEKKSEKNGGGGSWKRNAYGKKRKDDAGKRRDVRRKLQKSKRKLLRKK